MKKYIAGLFLGIIFSVTQVMANEYCVPNSARCYTPAQYRSLPANERARLIYRGNSRSGRIVNTRGSQEQAEAIMDNDKKQEATTGEGVNRDANRASDQSGSASGMNQGIGMALMAGAMACYAAQNPGCGAALSMMSMMAMMQSGADSAGQGYAADTGYDAEYGSGRAPASKAKDGSGLSSGQQRQFDEMKDNLADAGFTSNGDGTFTGPNGATIDGSAFSDPESAKLAGLDGEAIKQGLNIVSEAGNDLKTKKLVTGGDGGGGAGGYGKYRDDEDDAGNLNGKNSLLSELNRKSSVAGMTRTLAGDRIGVAGDNIFEMLSRRYQAKKRANAFLKD